VGSWREAVTELGSWPVIPPEALRASTNLGNVQGIAADSGRGPRLL